MWPPRRPACALGRDSESDTARPWQWPRRGSSNSEETRSPVLRGLAGSRPGWGPSQGAGSHRPAFPESVQASAPRGGLVPQLCPFWGIPKTLVSVTPKGKHRQYPVESDQTGLPGAAAFSLCLRVSTKGPEARADGRERCFPWRTRGKGVSLLTLDLCCLEILH